MQRVPGSGWGAQAPVWGERVRVVPGVRAGRGRGWVYERLWVV